MYSLHAAVFLALLNRNPEVMLYQTFGTSVCVVVVNCFKCYLWSLWTDWLQILREESWCGSLPKSYGNYDFWSVIIQSNLNPNESRGGGNRNSLKAPVTNFRACAVGDNKIRYVSSSILSFHSLCPHSWHIFPEST